jgi:hypothetical protein
VARRRSIGWHKRQLAGSYPKPGPLPFRTPCTGNGESATRTRVATVLQSSGLGCG